MTKLYHAKVKIDIRIRERLKTNVIIRIHFNDHFFMLIRSEYANRDLGDGVCVVMNNYCSLGTLLEFTKEFPTKMAKK